MKVFVYRNLRKNLISVRARNEPNAGKVIDWVENAVLYNPILSVSEASRQRVIRTKTKNVHAGVIGILKTFENSSDRIYKKICTAIYNPYKFNCFVDSITHKPITQAFDLAIVSINGVELYKDMYNDASSC